MAIRGYSIFGIGVARNRTLKWLFPQEKATFHSAQKVYVYSESAPASVTILHRSSKWLLKKPAPIASSQQ
jgi:hypothetical protein